MRGNRPTRLDCYRLVNLHMFEIKMEQISRGDCRLRQAGRSVCDICLKLHGLKTGCIEFSEDYTKKHADDDLELLKDILKTWTPSSSRTVSFDESVRYMIMCVLMEYETMKWSRCDHEASIPGH